MIIHVHPASRIYLDDFSIDQSLAPVWFAVHHDESICGPWGEDVEILQPYHKTQPQTLSISHDSQVATFRAVSCMSLASNLMVEHITDFFTTITNYHSWMSIPWISWFFGDENRNEKNVPARTSGGSPTLPRWNPHWAALWSRPRRCTCPVFGRAQLAPRWHRGNQTQGLWQYGILGVGKQQSYATSNFSSKWYWGIS